MAAPFGFNHQAPMAIDFDHTAADSGLAKRLFVKDIDDLAAPLEQPI